MTVPVALPTIAPAVPSRRTAIPSTPVAALLAAIGVLAVAVRAFLLVRTGGLLGIGEYDDGVYYTAADALVHGRLPYRDFLFLQPPGIALVLAPFAALGAAVGDPVGFGAARVAFLLIGGTNAVLIGVLLRRCGWVGMIVGGAGYAVFLPAAYPERSTLLEPVGTLGVLLALLLVHRMRTSARPGRLALAAGLVAGFSPTAKIWYVVPLAVIAIGVPGARMRIRYLLGAAAALVAVNLPFLVAAPAGMVRQVVLDQLGRARMQASALFRAAAIFGAPHGSVHGPFGWLTVQRAGTAGALVALVLVVVAWRASANARLYCLLLLADAVVLLLSPSWFPHYTALTSPMLALVVGTALARLLARVPARPLRAVVAVGVVLALSALTLHGSRRPFTVPVPAGVAAAARAVPGCVVSDDPSTLVVFDVLSRDLDHGCVIWPDVTGWTYDRDRLTRHGVDIARARNARWQRDVGSYLGAAGAHVAIHQDTGLSRATRAALGRGRLLARSGGWVLRGPAPVPR